MVIRKFPCNFAAEHQRQELLMGKYEEIEEVLPHLRSRQFHHSEHGNYPPLPHDNEEKIGARMMMEKVTN